MPCFGMRALLGVPTSLNGFVAPLLLNAPIASFRFGPCNLYSMVGSTIELMVLRLRDEFKTMMHSRVVQLRDFQEENELQLGPHSTISLPEPLEAHKAALPGVLTCRLYTVEVW